MQQITNFHDSRGRLTAYALACGYIESREVAGVSIKLWREHGTFHVRGHHVAECRRVFWDSFATLAPARARFNTASVTL